MHDTFRGGYFKALLDVRTMIEGRGDYLSLLAGIKSVKKARHLLVSYLSLVLMNPHKLDEMIDMGMAECLITPDGDCRLNNKKLKDF